MLDSSVPVNSNAVLTAYKSKVRSLEAEIRSSRVRIRLHLTVFLACIFLCAPLLLTLKLSSALYVVISVLALAASWQFREYRRCQTRVGDSGHRADFYERGIERIEGNWRGKGRSGLEFAREHHLYESDLDVLGEGSLFELLAATRSDVGAERLASFLLEPATVDEARARQEAVKELRNATGLRENIAILGRYQFQDCRSERLHDWLRLPVFTVHWILPVFLFFSGPTCFVLSLCAVKISLWRTLAPIFCPLVLAQGAICLALMRKVRARIRALLPLGGEIAILRQGTELIERQQFECSKLRRLSERLRSQNAGVLVRKLERLWTGVDRREDIYLYAFSFWLAGGTQLILAIERWRARHQRGLEDWLDAWSEFEALSALACYSWEHPHLAFPELLDEGAHFEAERLGHPLIPTDRCVGNDVRLNASKSFYVVSGSNMAGKSTFLRAIGLNAVLAAAGAPVCAASARTAVFRVCASIAITDSPQEGKSKFLAEIERLGESIRVAEAGWPTLFLVDEILSGTNSKDRRIAAEAFIRASIRAGAVWPATLPHHCVNA